MGKIVLLVFPQDGRQKLRPALVLREFPKYGYLLVCGISSKLQQYIEGFNLLLDEKHPDYPHSGLKNPGICRLSLLARVRKEGISGTIGQLSAATHALTLQRLASYLTKKAISKANAHLLHRCLSGVGYPKAWLQTPDSGAFQFFIAKFEVS